jgi:hypothetical protein
VRKLRKG